jgi:hypothetical protein
MAHTPPVNEKTCKYEKLTAQNSISKFLNERLTGKRGSVGPSLHGLGGGLGLLKLSKTVQNVQNHTNMFQKHGGVLLETNLRDTASQLAHKEFVKHRIKP